MIATRSQSRSASSIRVGRQEHRLAAGADAAHQVPDRPPRLRVEAGRQLVEKDEVGIVDERERDEEPLLLAARERHEPGVPLVGQTELLQQPIGVDGLLAVERRPEIDGLPYLDPLLQLCLLQLHANPLLQRVDVADRIHAEHRDRPSIRRAQPFDALHRRRLAGAVRPDQAEDLAVVNVERDLVDGDGRAVGLADARDVDDRGSHRLSVRRNLKSDF